VRSGGAKVEIAKTPEDTKICVVRRKTKEQHIRDTILDNRGRVHISLALPPSVITTFRLGGAVARTRLGNIGGGSVAPAQAVARRGGCPGCGKQSGAGGDLLLVGKAQLLQRQQVARPGKGCVRWGGGSVELAMSSAVLV
jgi:hypothetical protein